MSTERWPYCLVRCCFLSSFSIGPNDFPTVFLTLFVSFIEHDFNVSVFLWWTFCHICGIIYGIASLLGGGWLARAVWPDRRRCFTAWENWLYFHRSCILVNYRLWMDCPIYGCSGIDWKPQYISTICSHTLCVLILHGSKLYDKWKWLESAIYVCSVWKVGDW